MTASDSGIVSGTRYPARPVTTLSEVTDPAYLEGLESCSLDEVRRRRDEVTEVETGLSYLRRIVQGRLDIVLAEQRHSDSGTPAAMSELVEELPTILSDNVRAPGLGRLSVQFAPGDLDLELEQQLEDIIPASILAHLDAVGRDELHNIAERLTRFERGVSTQRRAVLDVLDELQDEVVRRYRSGEATVDSLLQ